MRTYASVGVQIPQVLIPRPGIDLQKWAVIACDQFTSQPEYWQGVEKLVGASPSTLHMVFPEVYLEQPDSEDRIKRIQDNMRNYLQAGYLVPYEGMIYVERSVGKMTRQGLMLCLDLERYDFGKGSQSLVRATEGTILDRLPPRIHIREGALLELPHILVLIDDPQGNVIEPVGDAKYRLNKLYDFDLMLDSGHLSGYLVHEPTLESSVVHALEELIRPDVVAQKYSLDTGVNALLFAMGDGNHSLATAKAIWEQIKARVGSEHPARYALVEVENIHAEALKFEPIHRVLFGVRKDLLSALENFYGGGFSYIPCQSQVEVVSRIEEMQGSGQVIGLVTPGGLGVFEVKYPLSNLPVGSLQAFLDALIKARGAEKIDYLHGEQVVFKLGSQAGNAGFYLPALKKSDLFKTVILDGVLPRKTFSMGEARHKRFYVECRKITL